VFITGASSGIGAACAKEFAKLKAKLILCARRLDALNNLSAELIEKHQVEVKCLPLDVRDYSGIQTTLANLPAEWQAIDILINNAGLALGLESLESGKVEEWEQVIDTNVKGLLYVTREILPQMVAKNSGHIINIGSTSAHDVYANGSVYCATKFALRAITKGLRLELAGKKIRVTEVDPGMVETEFSEVRFRGDKARAKKVYENVEALTAEDIADAIAYCATRPLRVNVNELILTPADRTFTRPV